MLPQGETVRPADLANLCALFATSGARGLDTTILDEWLFRITALNGTANPGSVRLTAADCGLVAHNRGKCFVTPLGRELGALQREIAVSTSPDASIFLLKRIFLDPSSRVSCAQLLLSFRADPVKGTMVYRREGEEPVQDAHGLRTLNSLGFLDVDDDAASVKKEHLGLATAVLAALRGSPVETSQMRTEIGQIGEECALKYEKHRLTASGHADLSRAIQHISSVDPSAGYDISSFAGGTVYPEEPVLLEVKATVDKEVHFVWTANERRVARQYRKRYWIYCFTSVIIPTRTAKGPVKVADPIAKLHPPAYSIEPIDVYVRMVRKEE